MTLHSKQGLDRTTTVSINHNKKFDSIEIDFNGKKPVELVRNWLKKNCFRWNPATKQWYITYTAERYENILFIFQNRTFETEDLDENAKVEPILRQNEAKTKPKTRQIATQTKLDIKQYNPLLDAKKEDVEIEIEQKNTKNSVSFVAKVVNPISQATSQKLVAKAKKFNANVKGKTFTFGSKKDLDNFVKPSTEPSQEQQQKVQSIPLTEIHTNKKLFQNRESDFSNESVNRILKAVENETFNWQMLDPILTWKNPKDGKLYVLSGHSRTEAFKFLAGKRTIYKGKKFDSIPAKVIETSQEDAVQIALNSNTLSTKETDLERANYYRNLRNNGKTKKEILALATENEGKNAKTILNLSYLSANGFLITSMKSLENSDTTNRATLQVIADWVGEAREKFTDLKNSHETELAKWLINSAYGTKTGQFTNKKAFYERLNVAIQKKTIFGKFEVETPLNMEKSVFKNNIEQEFDRETEDLKKAVSDAEKDLKKVSDNAYQLLKEGKTTQKRVDEVVAEKTKIFTIGKNKLQAHVMRKNDVLQASKQQTSLFGIKEDNEFFNQELEKFKNGELDANVIPCGFPSKRLLKCGIENARIELRKSTLQEKIKKHGLTVEDFKNLPQKISNPLMVFRSVSNRISENIEDAKVLLIELNNEEGKTAIIHLIENHLGIKINNIASVHNKEINKIKTWKEGFTSEGEPILIWEDTKKTSTLLGIFNSNGRQPANNLEVLTNIRKTPNKVMSARELSKMTFQEYDFTGKYLSLMGKPSEGFRMMLHGRPGGGKTTFLLQFAKYLCNNFGNVLYVSKEEYGSSTLTQKINKYLRPVPHNIDFSQDVQEIDLKGYNFVVLDSINDLGMDLKAFKELKAKYPKTAFILILQCTKAGTFKGGKEWEHEVEIGAEIKEAGIITVYKNRFDVKGELNFFDK